MGIHYSEFDVMFEFLKEEIPIPLSKALVKWEKRRKDKEKLQNEWIKLLEEKSRELMDENYSVGTAMLKAWDNYYQYALEDYQRDSLSIVDLRDIFFEDSLYMLERYEDSLTERRICSKCGKIMYDGYVIEDGMKYYCSDDCLYSELTKEEYLELYDGGSSYWTEFFGGRNKMKEKFYITKGIYETLDMRIITYIESLIKTMEVEVDYLQIFDLSGKTLIHTQEEPEYSKEHILGKEYEDEKLFCVRTDEADSSYWTLMLAGEY